tara:strand:- start:533 stop:1099 length:567 start_codon:yes stop_codon:yes gene_type:complete
MAIAQAQLTNANLDLLIAPTGTLELSSATTGTLARGTTLTQSSSNATGKIASDTVAGSTVLQLYDITGTFNTTNGFTVTTNAGTGTVTKVTLGGVNYAVTCIFISNHSHQYSASFDMHIVPNGDPIADQVTRVINDLPLALKETFTLDTEKIILAPGDKITFFARPSASGGDSSNLTDLNATISYVEI